MLLEELQRTDPAVAERLRPVLTPLIEPQGTPVRRDFDDTP
ncbi:hypothetical protein ABT391_16975 [Streptomyces jumonjinensis]